MESQRTRHGSAVGAPEAPGVIAEEEGGMAKLATRGLAAILDSGNGHGLKGATSLYRRIDLLDIGRATNIAGLTFDGATPLAPKGLLDPSIIRATSPASGSATVRPATATVSPKSGRR
jgi:hypothetical protein